MTADRPTMTDPHRVAITFDLDGEELGDRTHGQIAAQLEAMTLWALRRHGFRSTGIVGLVATVEDAE